MSASKTNDTSLLGFLAPSAVIGLNDELGQSSVCNICHRFVFVGPCLLSLNIDPSHTRTFQDQNFETKYYFTYSSAVPKLKHFAP